MFLPTEDCTRQEWTSTNRSILWCVEPGMIYQLHQYNVFNTRASLYKGHEITKAPWIWSWITIMTLDSSVFSISTKHGHALHLEWAVFSSGMYNTSKVRFGRLPYVLSFATCVLYCQQKWRDCNAFWKKWKNKRKLWMEGENGLNDYSFGVEPLAEMDFWTLYNCFTLKRAFESATWIMKNKWVLFHCFTRLTAMFISY